MFNHSKIQEIRAIVNDIERDIKLKNFVQYKKTFEYNQPYAPLLKAIYVDKYNMVGKYVEEAGSDDSALTISYYYHNKALRFVFIQGGAVNGSEMEHRIYFDAKGNRIWEIQKYLKGPGYCFPRCWPEESLVLEPWEEFNKY